MSRRLLIVLLSAVAIPAAAQTFGFSIGSSEPCLSIGNATYRLVAAGAQADYAVRIEPEASAPDIRVHLSNTLDEADFVLVDDGAQGACPVQRSAMRNVRIDAKGSLVVGLVSESASADFRIYVRSEALEPMAVAAMFAAAQAAGPKPPDRVVNRSN